MAPVPVMIDTAPRAEDDGITFIDDVDALAGTDVMFGCGDDNPFQ